MSSAKHPQWIGWQNHVTANGGMQSMFRSSKPTRCTMSTPHKSFSSKSHGTNFLLTTQIIWETWPHTSLHLFLPTPYRFYKVQTEGSISHPDNLHIFFRALIVLSDWELSRYSSLSNITSKPWEFVCLGYLMPNRLSNDLFCYQQQTQICQKATLLFMWEKIRRNGLWFQYLTCGILHSRTC